MQVRVRDRLLSLICLEFSPYTVTNRHASSAGPLSAGSSQVENEVPKSPGSLPLSILTNS